MGEGHVVAQLGLRLDFELPAFRAAWLAVTVARGERGRELGETAVQLHCLRVLIPGQRVHVHVRVAAAGLLSKGQANCRQEARQLLADPAAEVGIQADGELGGRTSVPSARCRHADGASKSMTPSVTQRSVGRHLR